MLPRHTSLANGTSPGPASPPQTPAHRAEQHAGGFKFGVPGPQFLEFLGPGGQSVAKGDPLPTLDVQPSHAQPADLPAARAVADAIWLSLFAAYEAAFQAAIHRMESIGGERVPVDFSAFCEIAMLLYNSAFVAERYSGIRAFIESSAVRIPLDHSCLAHDSAEPTIECMLKGISRAAGWGICDKGTGRIRFSDGTCNCSHYRTGHALQRCRCLPGK